MKCMPTQTQNLVTGDKRKQCKLALLYGLKNPLPLIVLVPSNP